MSTQLEAPVLGYIEGDYTYCPNCWDRELSLIHPDSNVCVTALTDPDDLIRDRDVSNGITTIATAYFLRCDDCGDPLHPEDAL